MIKINDVKLLEFEKIGDETGYLSVIEGNNEIPFSIERIFYIYGANGNSVRGKHANKNSAFLLISLNGKCSIKVIDSFKNEKIFELDTPNKGLYIPKLLWKEMYNFSENCVLLVLSDCKYDPDEYIKNFNEFVGDENNA